MYQLTMDEQMFFDGKPGALALYEAFREKLFALCPDVTFQVQKTQITFRNPKVFCCVSLAKMKGAKGEYMVVTFGLGQRLVSPRPADQMMTILPSSSDSSVTQKFFHLPESVAAPVKQGDLIGTVEIKLAGETIGVVDLIAGQDVNRNPVLFAIAQFQAFLGSLYLKVVLALSAIALAIYGIWWVQNTIREQRSWGGSHIRRH